MPRCGMKGAAVAGDVRRGMPGAIIYVQDGSSQQVDVEGQGRACADVAWRVNPRSRSSRTPDSESTGRGGWWEWES